MNFGEILKQECNNFTSEETLASRIFEMLKPIFLDYAKSRKNGCEIIVTGANNTVIKENLFQIIRKENIIVAKNKYLIWNDPFEIFTLERTPSPCNKCELIKCVPLNCFMKINDDERVEKINQFYSSLPTITINVEIITKNNGNDFKITIDRD